MMQQPYTTEELAELLKTFCTDNQLRTFTNIALGIESADDTNSAASIFVIKADVLHTRLSALAVGAMDTIGLPTASCSDSERTSSENDQMWDSYFTIQPSNDSPGTSLTEVSEVCWEVESLQPSTEGATVQGDHHGTYAAMHSPAEATAQVFPGSPRTDLARRGRDWGNSSTYSLGPAVADPRARHSGSTFASIDPDQTLDQVPFHGMNASLPNPDASLPDRLAARLKSARNTFLRDDCLVYLVTELPQWSNGALWQEAHYNRCRTDNNAGLYHNLQTAYSMACFLQTRMENDALRYRIALVELYNEYTVADEAWKTLSDQRGVGRGNATCIIDQILQNTHRDWHSLGAQDRKVLRARFHEPAGEIDVRLRQGHDLHILDEMRPFAEKIYSGEACPKAEVDELVARLKHYDASAGIGQLPDSESRGMQNLNYLSV
ncbi:hypothetical protein NLG97_g7980 [Lecanicillium saksenae]|uniref:Uncharacterized protein n=1 Tax=Lecanicillium saksenae TaxID=468837 RepID=A0ACC1QMT2_9HYPO|nr:hypothetical protein NLG97_g7980 [Lecanicillium saksenae]